MPKLRPELEAVSGGIPDRIRRLPLSERGYPIPWFVATLDDGSRDFRIMDPIRRDRAVSMGLCWVCGGRLGRYKAYVIGPMCAVNRVSAEPPSHVDCATFSAIACPFLSRPHAKRREAGMPEAVTRDVPGEMIDRNPGVALVWTISGAVRLNDLGDGEYLFNIGEPERTDWYAEGRQATREEVLASIDSGLPILRDMAESQGPVAIKALELQTEVAMELVPA